MDSISTLSPLVTEVTTLGEALSTARSAEAEAEAELAARIVEAVRPSLRYLSRRIQISGGHSGLATDKARTLSPTYYPCKGLRIAGKGPEQDAPRDNSGAYEGRDVWLLTDGTFLAVTYSGSWSRWQGSGDSWEGEVKAVEWTATRLTVEELTDGLVGALKAYLAKDPAKSAAAALDRAARLSALRALL